MKIKVTDYGSAPDQMTQSEYDCIWVCLASRKEPSPIEGPGLQWLDWRLRGILSRHVFEGKYAQDKVTFVATMRKFKVPFVAIDCDKNVLFKSFFKCSSGLKLNNVLVYCEDKKHLAKIEKHLKEHAVGDFPQNVTLGFDGDSIAEGSV